MKTKKRFLIIYFLVSLVYLSSLAQVPVVRDPESDSYFRTIQLLLSQNDGLPTSLSGFNHDFTP